MEELVKDLIPLPEEEQEFRVLPMVGLGGSRKTTMVSITQLSGIDHMGDDILAEMLLKALMEKRYLIVLDDVRKVEDWHKLTISLPNLQNGSRVIVTTRSDEVAELADLWGNPLRLH
ncbi:hypothetical protein ACJRO7_024351 [Eucalyptus globulus]|uniref:NB-ARC domain-containing protein n=1 Tax=Eucalyptus globulus TaxID=34317 RepID=A0ABD3K575_EUCGL